MAGCRIDPDVTGRKFRPVLVRELVKPVDIFFPLFARKASIVLILLGVGQHRRKVKMSHGGLPQDVFI